MRKTIKPAAACAIAIAITGAACGGVPTALTSELVANGMVRPIFVTHAPNDYHRIFVIQKAGQIRIIKDGSLLTTPFLDIDAIVGGGNSVSSEQGLLGLAFHPDYESNGLFYVDYTNNSGNTTIAEYAVSGDPDVADPGSARILMTIVQPQTNHNGGWLGFGPDGFLYIGTGDGGGAGDDDAGHTPGVGNGQDITDNLLGKMLRIDVNGDDFPGDPTRDYAIPVDNPFVGITGDDEIWAFGLRNPWRNSFDRMTGDLWIADVGQGLWEEVDFQDASSMGGENYGWRCREGAHDYNTTGDCSQTPFTEPIHEYSHSLGCSITGGYVYRGCAIPDLSGAYFFADYCSGRIWSMRYDGAAIYDFQSRQTELAPGGGLTIASITSFGEDAYGEMYICDQNGGEVFKIIPAGGPVGGDCNANGIDDTCEIMAGAPDVNGNGVIDECECVGDVNGSGNTDLSDLAQLLAAYAKCVGDPGYDPAADINNSGCVDLGDLAILLAEYPCTAP